MQPANIEEGFKRYFSNLFTSIAPSKEEISRCIQGICPKVNEEMNEILMSSLIKEEIEVALNQMTPFKSPGPDGFRVEFFQKQCQIMGKDVSAAVLSIWNGEGMSSSLKFAFISLIPKK